MTATPLQLAQRQEALTRAATGTALTNYPAIYRGFMDKGIPEADIQPRVNVFTYNAWKALGRQVRKGEHGVKVGTYVSKPGATDPSTGETSQGFKFPRVTTVFHISQTDPIVGAQ